MWTSAASSEAESVPSGGGSEAGGNADLELGEVGDAVRGEHLRDPRAREEERTKNTSATRAARGAAVRNAARGGAHSAAARRCVRGPTARCGGAGRCGGVDDARAARRGWTTRAWRPGTSRRRHGDVPAASPGDAPASRGGGTARRAWGPAARSARHGAERDTTERHERKRHERAPRERDTSERHERDTRERERQRERERARARHERDTRERAPTRFPSDVALRAMTMRDAITRTARVRRAHLVPREQQAPEPRRLCAARRNSGA